MRVQQLVNPKMRAGNKRGQLSRLWSQVRVLVVEEVGMVAAELRGFYPVEPYKAKGVKYVGEHVRRKEGKTVQ